MRPVSSGCTAPRRPAGENVIYYITVYNEPVAQPAEPEDVDVEGILKGIHHVAHPDRLPTATARACSCWPPGSATRGSTTPRRSSPTSGAWPPTRGRSPRGTSWPATRRRRGVEPAATRRDPAHGVRHRQAGRRARPGRGGLGLHAGRAAADRALGAAATTACSAPTGSASPTPGRPRAGSSTSTPSRSSSRRSRRSPTPAQIAGRRSRRRSAKYRIDDPTAVPTSSRRAATPSVVEPRGAGEAVSAGDRLRGLARSRAAARPRKISTGGRTWQGALDWRRRRRAAAERARSTSRAGSSG